MTLFLPCHYLCPGSLAYPPTTSPQIQARMFEHYAKGKITLEDNPYQSNYCTLWKCHFYSKPTSHSRERAKGDGSKGLHRISFSCPGPAGTRQSWEAPSPRSLPQSHRSAPPTPYLIAEASEARGKTIKRKQQHLRETSGEEACWVGIVWSQQIFPVL